MKEHHKHMAITILLVVLLAIVAINQYMLLTIRSSSRITGMASAGQTQQSLPQAESIIGIPYNEQGYQQLLNYDTTIRLNNGQMQDYVGLNVEMPCCGFQTLQAAGNCECGHHLALSGLAKYMIQKGYNKAEVQTEIDKWKGVFYPSSSGGNLGGC